MLNQIVLVGRLTQDLEIKELENGVKTCVITLAIPRSFKNMEGGYDTDFIDCTLFDAIASNTAEYCRKADIVGVKGRVQSRTNEDGKYVMEIVAEKVTFLSSRTKEENEEENEEE